MERVKFRTVSGEIYMREYERTTKIHDIKSMISAELNKDPKSILLIYKATVLEEDLTLSSINIIEDSYIIIHFIPENKYHKYSDSDINDKKFASRGGPQFRLNRLLTPIYPGFNQAHVKQLTDMGYSLERVSNALRRTRNDVARAANLLIMEGDAPPQEPVRATGPYGYLQSDFDSLTNDEKAEVEALRPETDRSFVLQAYLACNKNASQASRILDDVQNS